MWTVQWQNINPSALSVNVRLCHGAPGLVPRDDPEFLGENADQNSERSSTI